MSGNFGISDAIIHAVSTSLQNWMNDMRAKIDAIPQTSVSSLQKAHFTLDIAGMRSQILANVTVLYPMEVTRSDINDPLWVQSPPFFVVTSQVGNIRQAAVLTNRGGPEALAPGNHTAHKDIFIKGPTAPTTSKALDGLLQHTNHLMAEKWSEYMNGPLEHDRPVKAAGGALYYKRG